MKTLLGVILVVVFSIGYLISPDSFSPSFLTPSPVQQQEFQPQVTANPTALPTTVDEDAIRRPTATQPAAAEITDPDANNPSSLFGDAKIVDTFERGSSGFGINAGLNDDEAIRIVALNNRLSITPKKNNGWLSWRLRPPSIKDGAVEMTFAITTCARGDRTGIVMRAPDYTNGHGYYISLACEGTVSILRDSFVIASAGTGSAFHNNSGDINILTAIVQGNNLNVLLNGIPLLQTQDTAYTEGYCGFFTAPQEQNTLTMDISSFSVYYPD